MKISREIMTEILVVILLAMCTIFFLYEISELLSFKLEVKYRESYDFSKVRPAFPDREDMYAKE